MPTCPECGTEQTDSRFCAHCGAALPRPAASGDASRHAGWEDRAHHPRRGRTAGTVVAAVLVAVALAAVALGQDRDAPQTAPSPAGDVPTATELAAELPTPPRPVTDAMACPDGQPGCVLWRTDFPGVDGLTAPTPGRDPRHVYVGASLPDGGGALYAIDPTNGIQLWRRPLPGPPQRPLLAPGGSVVIAHGDPDGTGLRAFDPDTGRLRWQLGGALQVPSSVGPAAAGGTVAVGGPGGVVLRPSDGRPVTLIELDDVPVGLLGWGGGPDAGFLVQTNGEQVRAHARDGSLLWARTGSRLGTAVEEGRSAVVDAPDHVVGVDVRAGEVWRTRVAVGDGPLVVNDGHVFTLSRAGELVRLSLEDGRELGRTSLPEPTPAFAVDRGMLFPHRCGEVRALDVRTGQELWSTPLEPPGHRCVTLPVGAPGDGLLLVGAGDALYGLRP